MTSVLSDINNGNIANLYLFYGEEAFKKRNFKELLKKTVVQGNMMNFSGFEGKDIDWQAVYDAVVTMPFFAEKRLVIVENSGQFKAKKGDDAPKSGDEKSSSMMDKILKDLPPSTCLAFFEEGAAKNKKTYKTIAAKGIVEECNADTEEDLINWLARGFSREGKKVRKSTLQLLIGRVGLDYDKLRMEFEKIISYVGERTVIEDTDIREITTETIESRIFDLLNAMSEKNVGKVLEKYYDLLANREHPLYIMAMLRSQFRTMLQIAEFSASGMSAYEIAKAAGKPAFAVKNTLGYLRHFSRQQIEEILEEISETDRKCKTGEILDQIGVELMLIKFSC